MVIVSFVDDRERLREDGMRRDPRRRRNATEDSGLTAVATEAKARRARADWMKVVNCIFDCGC